jgi:hypothetical protein
MPPILDPFSVGGRHLRHLMAGGGRVIALQSAPARTATLRSEVNHPINFLHRLELAPRSVMSDLRALFFAARFTPRGTTMLWCIG